MGTDAPLTSVSLRRIARRASFGLARAGGMASHSSGDIALAFSTVPVFDIKVNELKSTERYINDLFRACIESVEESIINSLLRSNTVVGRDGNTVNAISIDELKDLL